MAPQFEFIDNSLIDRKSRRTIRSHVMKGRNLGKVRTPRRPFRSSRDAKPHNFSVPYERSYEKNKVILPDLLFLKASSQQDGTLSGQNETRLRLITQVGNGLSVLASTWDLTPSSQRIILNFVHFARQALDPVEFCNDAIWFQYALTDEAFFHCFAALSEACMGFLVGKDSYTHEYRQHMGRALRLINDKMSSSHAVTNTNIASVIFLCLLSSFQEHPLNTKTHFDGLCRMIDMRGGIDALMIDPAVVKKAQRVEIDLALQLGVATRLGQSDKVFDAIASSSSQVLEVHSPLIDIARHAGFDVFSAAQDIMRLSCFFNAGVAGTALDPNAHQDLITTTCYRLMGIRPIDTEYNNVHSVAGTVYLALLTFMATLLFQIGSRRRLGFTSLSRKLMSTLDDTDLQAFVNPTTYLWLLLIAGMPIRHEIDRIWLRPRLIKAAKDLDVTDWEHARTLLYEYPWISSLHDLPAAQLWQCCFDSSIDYQ